MGIFFSVLISVAVLCFGIYSVIDYFKTKHNAKMTVVGKITGAHCDSVLASALADTTPDSYWYIEYIVDGKTYNIRKTASGSNKKVRSYIGSTVIVHYDPNHPKKAWAEKP